MKAFGVLIFVLAVGSQAQPPAELSLQSMLKRGQELQASGRHQESLVHFENALRLAEVTDTSWESSALDWLASAYLELRRFAEADRALVRCLELRNMLWGPSNENDPNHARILTSAGGVELVLGQYKKAEEHLDMAMRVWRKIPGRPTEWELADHLNNIAMLNYAQGRYSDAERRLREAVAVLEKCVPADDRRLAKARYNLAGVLNRLGKNDEADKFSSQALEAFRHKLEHEPQVAAELISIRCSVLRKAKRGKEAKALETLARELMRKTQIHDRIDVSLLGRRQK